MPEDESNRLVSKTYGDLDLTLAQLQVQKDELWTTTLAPGFWCGVVATGSVNISSKIYQGNVGSTKALNFYLQEPLEVDHVVPQDCNLNCVFVHLPLDSARSSLGADCAQIMPYNSDRIHFCEQSRTLRALSLQLLTAPMIGPLSEYYIAGKTFELFSLGLAEQAPQAVVTGLHSHAELRADELERTYLAREILLASLENPPTVPDLAKRVGFSVNRLRVAFQAVFGETISTHLRNARLDSAKTLIEIDGCMVAEAARVYGFGVAHFSTIFRNRYGYSPSSLRRGRRS